ncbi:hypothetical protein ACFL45_08060 [Candidatus Neomarinimicrobiota bacterium]
MRRSIAAAIALMFATQAYGDDGSLSGLVFYEFSHEFDDTVAVNNAFEMQRVYLTYQKEISPALAFRFQTDVARGQDNWLTVYLKNTKMDWTTSLGKVTFGLQGMNVFNVQEKTWGHRYLEKSPMDKYGFASSADMGIGYARPLGDHLYLDAKVTNGTGYKKPEDDKFKKLSMQLVWGETDLTKDDGFNIGGVATYEPFEGADGTSAATTVIALLGGWSHESLRAGVELNLESQSDDSDATQIMAGYATYALHHKLAVLARIDVLTEESNTETYAIVGIALSPEKGLRITPNVRYLKTGDSEGWTSFRVNLEFKI